MHPGSPAFASAARAICPGCGIVAPSTRGSCGVCGTAFASPPLAAPGRLGSVAFACIHGADFTCKACGIRSPLGTLDLEGRTDCWGCGLEQAFDPVQWKDALGHAHDTVDLAGFAGSRHAGIGTQHTSSTKTQNGLVMDAAGTRTHSLRTTVSPGHPLCKTCHVALEVRLEGAATITRCPRCATTARYALPGAAGAICGALRGIIAGEARTDQPVARVVRGAGGVTAPGCPQCGAALSAGDGEIVRCTFCNTTARVPGPLARQQRRGQAPKMEPFWVLLDGPSPGRRKLAAGRSEDDDDDVPPAPVPYGALPHAPVPHAAPAPAWVHPNAHYAPPPSRKGHSLVVVGMAVAVLVLLALGGLVAYSQLAADDEPAPPVKATPAKKKTK